MSRVNKSFMIGESPLVLECFSSSFVSLIGENSLADDANRRSTGVLGRDLWDFTLLTKHKHERAKYEIYSDSKVNFTTRLEQNVEVTFAHDVSASQVASNHSDSKFPQHVCERHPKVSQLKTLLRIDKWNWQRRLSFIFLCFIPKERNTSIWSNAPFQAILFISWQFCDTVVLLGKVRNRTF